MKSAYLRDSLLSLVDAKRMMENVYIPTDLLNKYVEMIRKHPLAGPGEAELPQVVQRAATGWIYITFEKPEVLPLGAIYRTWVVMPETHGDARLTLFKSRRGAGGDDTLPPD